MTGMDDAPPFEVRLRHLRNRYGRNYGSKVIAPATG